MPDDNSINAQPVRPVKVWDIPTRVFHWLMALVVFVVIASQEGGATILLIHVYFGTLLIGFVVFRLLWGIIGSRHALFSDFVSSMGVVKNYARRLFSFSPPYVLGHNPLGGWVVIALLVLTLLAVLTGMMHAKGAYTGPLAHIFAAHALAKAHGGFGNILIILVSVHICGVIGHSFISGENLPRTMISGVKHVPLAEKAEDIRSAGIIRPFIAIVVGTLSVWYLLSLTFIA